jgi:hypothetical protein
VWKACFEERQRPRHRLWSANTAMHLSRRRNVLFFAEKTLQPGDGERYPFSRYILSTWGQDSKSGSMPLSTPAI